MVTQVFPAYCPPKGAKFNENSAFSDPLQIELDLGASNTLDKDMWRVTSAFKFYLTLAGDTDKGKWVYVPAGYLTDGASVPRMFWDFIRPWGEYGQAAVIHDILCEYLTVFDDDNVAYAIDRNHANTILNEAMKALNVPSFIRFMITNSVRGFNIFDRIIRGNIGPRAYAKKRALEAAWVPRDDVAKETIDTTSSST